MARTQAELKKLEAICDAVGTTIHRTMPDGVGYALLVFGMGEEGWITYMSNAERVDMIKAMRELIGKMEREMFSGVKA
jgi:hypothetical protein